MEGRAGDRPRRPHTASCPCWLLGLVPLLLILAAIGAFARSAARAWASGAGRRRRSWRSRRPCSSRARSS